MKNVYIMIVCLLFARVAWGQKVQGYVYDAANKNTPMVGVTVFSSEKSGQNGTITDEKGYYELEVPEGSVMLTYSYLGYEEKAILLIVKRKETLTQDVYMQPSSFILDDVVVSAGRFEQKLSDVTVSMDVLKASDVARQSSSDIRSTLVTIPGVEITDKQPSIRGGSGWTYGVGSRALILLDGMSILSPAGGEINWNAIPVDNVDQIEVIKGASSVLYGSSALNGLINVRTKRPGIEPETRINAYMGVYGNPKNENYIWWNRDFWNDKKYPVKPLLRQSVFSGIRNPIYNGLDVSHSRRIGHWDVSANVNLFTDEGYKQGGYNKRVRAGVNVAHHNPKVDGLHYGLNANFLSDESGDAFIWRSPEEAYMQSPLTNMARQGNDFYLDPFINYYNNKNNTSHKIKGRMYFTSDNIITKTTDKSIINILDNMGFDYVKSVPEIVDIVKNPGQLIPSFLPPLLEGDINKLADAVMGLGNHFFPTAKPADYVDLISWVTGRMPLPTNESDLVKWVLNADKLKPAKVVHPDRSSSYYLDYQFHKQYDRAQITAGATYEHVKVDSRTTGIHQSDNAALYFQYDDRFFDRLSLSLGARFEYYRVDSKYREAETKIFGTKIPVKPVLRAGLNYQVAEYSFLRASFGQGYRYPSITEKFVYKNIGGIAAYPNPNLKPESGFNAELGFKQGYRVGPFKGYLDVSGFYTEYKDMIEFNIGLFNTKPPYQYLNSLADVLSMIIKGDMPGIGAQFSNVERARIYGVDISTNGIWNINPHTHFTYNLGYVYIEPEDMNYKKQNAKEDAYTDPLQMKSKSNSSKYLKYRQKHSVKAIFDFQWKRLSVGTNLMWRSKTLAVDYFMADERPKAKPDAMDYVRYLLFGDLAGYWRNMNKGFFTMDLRVGVKVVDNVSFQASVHNLLNKEYSVRPMDVSAPRTFLVQMTATF